MVRPDIIDTLRKLHIQAIAAGDTAAVEALTVAVRRMHGAMHARPVEARLSCGPIAPGMSGCASARWYGQAWHPCHVELEDRDRWEVVCFMVGDYMQPLTHLFDGDDFRMAENGWDIELQVVNRGADAAAPKGRLHGYAASMSDRLRAVARDMDYEAKRLEEAAVETLLGATLED